MVVDDMVERKGRWERKFWALLVYFSEEMVRIKERRIGFIKKKVGGFNIGEYWFVKVEKNINMWSSIILEKEVRIYNGSGILRFPSIYIINFS